MNNLPSLKLPGPQILVKWPNDVYVIDQPGHTFGRCPTISQESFNPSGPVNSSNKSVGKNSRGPSTSWLSETESSSPEANLNGKLAGILVRASVSSLTDTSGNQPNGVHHIDCLIGAGVNVSNSRPTVCLHDIIKRTRRILASKNPGYMDKHILQCPVNLRG
ncbi:unnamed protein product [Protopolystoma xenopodis]|uniref:BPL/LPL catalytic domain-containing protein n=1 Tax=Protopolystoma xenopodis TaxID=117903 RepID=A0A3S5CNI0_9PLAT|nr:unnamed protein product [Protopolystoma xenopodis]